MKNLKIISLVLVIAGTSFAQMTPKYDTYTTYSIDANNNISQTVVVEGYTTTSTGSCNTTCCQSSPYPPYYSCWSCPIPGCATSTHTPKINNVIGGIGGWSTGPASNPFSYMSYQTTSTAQGVPGQTMNGTTTEAQVVCSVVGTIFDLPGSPVVSITQTYWGPPPIVQGENCFYNMLACSTGTPTCMSVTPGLTFALSCPDYLKAEYLVINGTCSFALAWAASGPGLCN